jgi:site-specific recombinase XerD
MKSLILNSELGRLINLVIVGLNSEHSKKAYEKAIKDFMFWYIHNEKPGLTKWTIQQYKSFLQKNNLSPSTINQRLSAIRKLAQEAADNDLISQSVAISIANVKGVRSYGVKTGNWLTKLQAQELINKPDTDSLGGLRDRAILSLMVGAGLRRSEVSKLRLEDIQQRDGRWAIVDLLGKGNRVRTIPIPAWAKMAIDEWINLSGIMGGRIFMAVNKGDELTGSRIIRKGKYSSGYLTGQAIADIVQKYAEQCGFDNIAAHDLRRTFSKLAKNGGADLKQIQITLGHASIKTTERYLGIDQNLTDAPCDKLGISLER